MQNRMYHYSYNPLFNWLAGSVFWSCNPGFWFWFGWFVLSAMSGALSFYVIRFFVRIIRYVHNKTKP